MLLNYYQLCRKFVLSLFCILSFGGILSGMSLCLIKSPENQARDYTILADQYLQQAIHRNDEFEHLLEASENMALTAISYTPYDDKLWQKFSLIRENYQDLLKPYEDQSLAFSSFE